MAVCAKVQTEGVGIIACNTIPTYKPANSRNIVPCSQVNCTGLSIIVFAAVTESICVRVIDILFNTESVILVCLSDRTCAVNKIYYITVCVLDIIGIIRLYSILVSVLSGKICSSDVAVSFIVVAMINICDDLLCSISHMVDSLTVYCLLVS